VNIVYDAIIQEKNNKKEKKHLISWGKKSPSDIARISFKGGATDFVFNACLITVSPVTFGDMAL
jgi:hypothetical protein